MYYIGKIEVDKFVQMGMNRVRGMSLPFKDMAVQHTISANPVEIQEGWASDE